MTGANGSPPADVTCHVAPAEVLRCGRDPLPLDMETLQANFPCAIEEIAVANCAMTDSVGYVTHLSERDATSPIWVVSL